MLVVDLTLLQQPWVAIFCKAPPYHTNTKGVQDHKDEMKRVIKCLQGLYGFKYRKSCNAFGWSMIWAIARLGNTSDMRKVKEKRINAFHSTRYRIDRYIEVAGEIDWHGMLTGLTVTVCLYDTIET